MEFYLPEGADLQALYDSAEYKAMNERFQKERRWEAYGDLREHGDVLRKRVTAVVDELVERHKGERIALVSHGPTIGAYVAGDRRVALRHPHLDPAHGITTILAHGDRRRILTSTRRPHFGA